MLWLVKRVQKRIERRWERALGPEQLACNTYSRPPSPWCMVEALVDESMSRQDLALRCLRPEWCKTLHLGALNVVNGERR